jgi:hypothetical protein
MHRSVFFCIGAVAFQWPAHQLQLLRHFQANQLQFNIAIDLQIVSSTVRTIYGHLE